MNKVCMPLRRCEAPGCWGPSSFVLRCGFSIHPLKTYCFVHAERVVALINLERDEGEPEWSKVAAVEPVDGVAPEGSLPHELWKP